METLGKKLGFTADLANFHNVSLGQGQEVVAEEAMDTAATNGHWVVLQVQVQSLIALASIILQGPSHLKPFKINCYLENVKISNTSNNFKA